MIEIRVLLGKLLGSMKARKPSICANCEFCSRWGDYGKVEMWQCHIPEIDGSRMDYLTGQDVDTTVLCRRRNKYGACDYHKPRVTPLPV